MSIRTAPRPDQAVATAAAAPADVDALQDVHASDPVERLLEESWDSRSRRASRRGLLVEGSAAALFLAIAVPAAVYALHHSHVDLPLAGLLVALYAIVSRTVKFPIGAGYFVPSYLVLVPMLLLLPPLAVPLLAAAGLLLGTGGRMLARRASARELLFAIPDAWHAFGPAIVLALAPAAHGADLTGVYLAAFAAGCLVDLAGSALRESLILGIAPKLQGRVIASVWMVDACIAPLGLLFADAARRDAAQLLLLAPLNALLILSGRDRNARIAEAQHRLAEVARQRSRLQAAVHRLGEAFAAKLDLRALTDVLLNGSIDALDAGAGHFTLSAPRMAMISATSGTDKLEALLQLACAEAQSAGQPRQCNAEEGWALAVPFQPGAGSLGALAVARFARGFSEDERELLVDLVERAETAAAEILAHELLREQAHTDPLTRLGNRRKLSEELGARLAETTHNTPLVLMLFDLDGFKTYNDTFGHPAGDALLARLGRKLQAAASPRGEAFRLGGDEFCVLLPADDDLQNAATATLLALEERSETFAITASCGSVLLPHEATSGDYALQLADERMYSHKRSRRPGAGEQAHDVLIHLMRTKQNDLQDHSSSVARLAVRVGRRLGMNAEQLDELGRAAALHDIGKLGIPDAILTKPGPLDAGESDFIRQHTVLGERILSAAPALRPVATIVRASHERWDGTGYPDRLQGQQIPLAARIVAVCDAYDAITTDRCYRRARAPESARAELVREAGHQFDVAVVATFLEELDPDDTREAKSPPPDHTAERPKERIAEIVAHIRQLLEQHA
ncbi:MAG: HD domain-containing phosphohydrolase [Solirubrobacteraceae bacterium]